MLNVITIDDYKRGDLSTMDTTLERSNTEKDLRKMTSSLKTTPVIIKSGPGASPRQPSYNRNNVESGGNSTWIESRQNSSAAARGFDTLLKPSINGYRGSTRTTTRNTSSITSLSNKNGDSKRFRRLNRSLHHWIDKQMQERHTKSMESLSSAVPSIKVLPKNAWRTPSDESVSSDKHFLELLINMDDDNTAART